LDDWSAFTNRFIDILKLNRYVLYKERNMLLTEQQLSRRKGLNFPQPDRILKVRKSMGAIKHVLGERKREHLIQVNAARKKRLTNDDDDEPLPQSA
jgi:Mitochondrial 39-S ribosomal protein L47 (MRP-L47)